MEERWLQLLAGLLSAFVALSPAALAEGATLTYIEPHGGCASSGSSSTLVEDDGTTRRETVESKRHHSCENGQTVVGLHVDEQASGGPSIAIDDTRGSDSSRASTSTTESDATGSRTDTEAQSSTASRSGYTVTASAAGRSATVLAGCKTRSSVDATSSSEEGSTSTSRNESRDVSQSLCGVHAVSGATATSAGAEGGCAGRTGDSSADGTSSTYRTGTCRDGLAFYGPVTGFAGIESGIRETCTNGPHGSSCGGQVYHLLTVETSAGPGARVPLPLGLLRLVLP